LGKKGNGKEKIKKEKKYRESGFHKKINFVDAQRYKKNTSWKNGGVSSLFFISCMGFEKIKIVISNQQQKNEKNRCFAWSAMG